MNANQAFVLATPHFDRNTSYVALSRHKEDVKLYTNAKDFKNDWRLHNTLGRKSEKLSTLDFTNSIEKEEAPTSEQPKQLSFFQRLKNFFTRGQTVHQPELQPVDAQQTQKWINEPMPERQDTPQTTRSMDRKEFEKREYLNNNPKEMDRHHHNSTLER